MNVSLRIGIALGTIVCVLAMGLSATGSPRDDKPKTEEPKTADAKKEAPKKPPIYDSTDQNSKEKVPSMQEASDAIQKALKLKADSYQVLLRDFSRIVPPVLRGQEWTDMQTLMRKNSFATVEAWENGDAVHSYHLLKKNAVELPRGFSLDLYLLLSAPNLDRPKGPARPGKLYAADVALIADFNEPYPTIIGEERYAKGSVLDVILGTEQVKAVGEVWPLLKKVYVFYGYIDDRWSEQNPSGFHVCVEFTASATQQIAGKKLDFSVASGLDPWRSRDGKKVLRQGFKSQDTLGDVSIRGGNEWWYGDNAAVEANKRKYLKAKQ
jgi:hypothetical protein